MSEKELTVPAIKTKAPVKTNGSGAKAVDKPVDNIPKADHPEPHSLRGSVKPGSPYTLESSNLYVEFERIQKTALNEIRALDADMENIKNTAQAEMEAIAARAKTEIDARMSRISDLRTSLNLLDNGLNGTTQTAAREAITQDAPPDDPEGQTEQ